MAHNRDRHLNFWLKRFIKSEPSLCLIGQRQTGKTTLLEDNASTTYKLDKDAVRAKFERELNVLLNAGPYPILIDEAQKLPKVFDEIKGLIDEKKTPGRFFLTGSIRFSSKRAIQESLTGRTLVLELLPFGIAESHHKKLSHFWLDLFEAPRLYTSSEFKKIEKNSWAQQKQIMHFLNVGGLPGLCFLRDKTLRAERMSAHIDTLLGRDLQEVYKSKLSVTRLRELLRIFATQQGLAINFSHIGRQIGVTAPTVQEHLRAFCALFLLRDLGKVIYFEDQGMATHLVGESHGSILDHMRRAVFAELQQQKHYLFRSELSLETWQPLRGNAIPFILSHTTTQKKILVCLDESTRASDSSLKTLSWYQKKHPKALGVILHNGDSGTNHNGKIISLPMTWIF